MSEAVPPSCIISEAYAGLQAQALGLAEAAGLQPELRILRPRAPWRFLPPRLWPAPLRGVAPLPHTPPGLLLGCGGVAASVGSALRRPDLPVVHVQHPRMDPGRFDLVVVARHDALTGRNVLVTRTALHRVTAARLAAARQLWAPRLAHLPRPLVAILVGGTNGRFRLDLPVGAALADQLAAMMQAERIGLALTASRRTGAAVQRLLAERLGRLGAWVWDGAGDNPYFGLLGLADAIVVTIDSVSMLSEAVATHAPVMLARLPGHSRRIAAFVQLLQDSGRVREFRGRYQDWQVEPLDDTAEAAAQMRRRLQF